MPTYRLWGSTEDGKIEFESLTNETLKGAIKVLREGFFPLENICKGVALLAEPGASAELVELSLEAVQDGVSVVAVEVATGDVVGVVFNKIQVQNAPNEPSYFEEFRERCECKSSRALMEFMMGVDSKVNLFKHYNVECILEIMFLVTSPTHTRRRIAELLVSCSMEIGKELKNGKAVKSPVMIKGDDRIHNYDCVPGLVSAIMTSNYSKKVATKLGFDLLYEAFYDQYHHDGAKYSDRIGKEHLSSILCAKRL